MRTRITADDGINACSQVEGKQSETAKSFLWKSPLRMAHAGAQGHCRGLQKNLVRDEGVAGSNPATPTNLLSVVISTGPDMGNETPRASR